MCVSQLDRKVGEKYLSKYVPSPPPGCLLSRFADRSHFLVVLGSADKVVGGGEVGEEGDNSTLVQR